MTDLVVRQVVACPTDMRRWKHAGVGKQTVLAIAKFAMPLCCNECTLAYVCYVKRQLTPKTTCLQTPEFLQQGPPQIALSPHRSLMDREKERCSREHLLLSTADTQLEMCGEAVALVAGHHVHEADRALVENAFCMCVAYASLSSFTYASSSTGASLPTGSFAWYRGVLAALLGRGTITVSHKDVKPSHCHDCLRPLRRLRRIFGRHGSLDPAPRARDSL
jgi:hypothetical protein